MTEKVVSTCASCGARLNALAKQCHLCGWVVGTVDHDLRSTGKKILFNESVDIEPEPDNARNLPSDSSQDSGIYCHNCGWKNPSEANFCSACGTKLQKVERPAAAVKKAELPPELKQAPKPEATGGESSAADAAISDQTPENVSRLQVAMLMTASVLIVGALYMITVFSKRAFPTTEAAPQQQQAEASIESSNIAPLSADMEARVQSLMSEATALSGDAQVEKKREIVSMLAGIQRFDRAAPVQEEIAGLSGRAEDWFQAGNFYYDWMDQLSGAERPTVAQRAVSAYEQGLSIKPDDLVVRTALAMAYLNTSTPMLGITQIRQVLDEDPDHLEGNFYFGVMLMQINRLDQAKERFERVKELVGPGNPMFEQADIMLNNISTLTR